MPFVKNSNITAVRQYSIAVPCIKCMTQISSIAHINNKGQYDNQISYYRNKATVPHSHA